MSTIAKVLEQTAPPTSLTAALRLLCLFLLSVWLAAFDPHEQPVLMFQSPLPPVQTRPEGFIYAPEGGTKIFGSTTIYLPPDFTMQSGANIFGDFVQVFTLGGNAPGILPGTEFAFGIWPANDQTEYEKPIVLRFGLDRVSMAGKERQLEVRMYNPSLQQWVSLPTQFDSARYQLVVSVQVFTPVAKDFRDWGGRTFLGIFPRKEPGLITTTTASQTPIIKSGANLRSGPGTNYPIVGSRRAGQSVELDGRTFDGGWYRLRSGEWIAAFLVNNAPPDLPVVTSVPTPAPRATIVPTSTFTPKVTPTKTPKPS